MKLDYMVADPAGNITVFVLSDVPKEQYVPVAEHFLADPALKAEQVGFVKPPILGGEARLEMMGGEFCGNAARSFGLLCSRGRKAVSIEITGSSHPLQVSVTGSNAQVEMPLPQAVGDLDGTPAVIFEGIVHLIVQDKKPNEGLVKQLIAAAEARFHPEATGVLFTDGRHMTPVVYVKGTETTVWERSCGSGTFALACFQALKQGDGNHRFGFIQPGGLISAQVEVKDGSVHFGTIGGPVALSEKKQREI